MKQVTIFDDYFITFSKGKRNTKVSIEGINISIENSIIEAIGKKTEKSVEEYVVVILIAQIKLAKFSTSHINRHKLEDDTIIESLPIILEKYDEEVILTVFNELKYSEIVNILENENPAESFQEYC